MGALDVALTFHFVEAGLEIIGEEGIKVMDEYIAPNCAALMELGREFYCSWTLRRRTLAGSLVNTSRQCCTAQSSFNRFALQISLPLTHVERAQDTARSVSSSCKYRRIAGTFDPRVSQNVDRQPLDVQEHGHGLGPQAKRLRCRQRRFFRVAQRRQTASFQKSFLAGTAFGFAVVPYVLLSREV